MTAPCPRVWRTPLVGVGVVVLAACRASLPGATGGGAAVAGAPSASGASSASASPGPVTVARYAESLPITALAVGARYVWAGTAQGLRRWKAAGRSGADDVDAEALGADSGLPGRRIDALGLDAEGRAWVATDAGIGRFAERAGHVRFEARGTLPSTTMLLVPARTGGEAWAAGPAGLARYDGHGWTPQEFLRDVPVTSLELDADGQSVWAGTYGHGLYRVDASGGKPMLPAGAADAGDEIVGTAATPGGARLVAARSGDGGRIILVTREGAEVYRTQAEAGVRFVRLVASGAGPVLVAAIGGGVERLYQMSALPRGEAPGAGGFRLVSTRKGSTARYQALPMALFVPPDVTVVASAPALPARDGADAEVWVGSRAMGVARAEPRRPRYLSGDLTDDADRLSVACTALDHCFVVAGGAHAWLFDGARFHETRLGESPEGRALAVVTDRNGAVFAVVTDPPFRGIALLRHAPGPAGDVWQPVQTIAVAGGGEHGGAHGGARGAEHPSAHGAARTAERTVERSVERPSVSFATFSPGGSLWLGIGSVGADGQEQGRGAVEIVPAPGGPVVRHGAFPGNAVSDESLPLPHDLTGVIFDGAATWFSARSGINRWQESELRHWGENEHMDSEVCLDVVKGVDGQIWVATTAGVGRFDGTEWRFAQRGQGQAAVDGDSDGAAATRAIVDDGAGRMWLATAKGLRVLGAADARAPRLGSGATVVDDDVLDLALDRYGRVWALGSAALAVASGQMTTGIAAAGTAGGTR